MRFRWMIPAAMAAALPAQRPAPIDNDWARVVVAASRPGPKGALHKHDRNRVMIYLDAGSQRLEFEGGPARDVKFRAGEALWDTKGGMHTSQNTGGGEFRVVEIELKKDGGTATWPALDPPKVAPGIYKVEIDNQQVRVVRVRLAPRQKIPEHEHRLNRVVVAITEVRIEVTSADGSKNTVNLQPGEATFGAVAQPIRHREENLLDKPIELLMVELKG